MTEAKSGLNGYRKALKPVLSLSIVFLLLWSSVLWAGPMGDPEPVESGYTQAPVGPSTYPTSGSNTPASSLSVIELAIVLVGMYL